MIGTRAWQSIAGMRIPRTGPLVVGTWLAMGCNAGPLGTPTKPDPGCTSITGTLPGEVAFAGCTDGRTRALSCKRSTPDEKAEDVFCACMIGDKMGASFMLFSDTVDAATDPGRAIQIGNRRCGWELAERS